MSSFYLRPRFEQVVDMDPEPWREWIVARFQEVGDRFEVRSFSGFVALRVPEEDRHFWSPRLNLSLEEAEPGKTRVQGFYGPNANVWSLFLFFYLFVGMIALITGVFALSQWMVGSHPWGFWLFGGSIAVLLGLYLTAQFGQKLGAYQTFQLHQLFEAAIGRTISIR